jgi:hypothetical protein
VDFVTNFFTLHCIAAGMNDGLTGMVPTELKELTKLQDLRLSGTALTVSVSSFPLRGVIESYYPDGSYLFVKDTDQYDALELLANSDTILVPDDYLDSNNLLPLLLQRYVLMVLYLATTGNEWNNGKWLEEKAASKTCNWSGVTCSDGSSIDMLDRTCSTVKTEPVICHMRQSLTTVLFSKSIRLQPFRKSSYGNWISGDTPSLGVV